MERHRPPRHEDPFAEEPRSEDGEDAGAERAPDDAELWSEYQARDRQIRDQIAGDRLQTQEEIFEMTDQPVRDFLAYLREIEPIPELQPYRQMAGGRYEPGA